MVDDSTVQEQPDSVPERAHLVKAEWFWACIQMDAAADESMYRFQTPAVRVEGCRGYWPVMRRARGGGS